MQLTMFQRMPPVCEEVHGTLHDIVCMKKGGFMKNRTSSFFKDTKSRAFFSLTQ